MKRSGIRERHRPGLRPCDLHPGYCHCPPCAACCGEIVRLDRQLHASAYNAPSWVRHRCGRAAADHPGDGGRRPGTDAGGRVPGLALPRAGGSCPRVPGADPAVDRRSSDSSTAPRARGRRRADPRGRRTAGDDLQLLLPAGSRRHRVVGHPDGGVQRAGGSLDAAHCEAGVRSVAGAAGELGLAGRQGHAAGGDGAVAPGGRRNAGAPLRSEVRRAQPNAPAAPEHARGGGNAGDHPGGSGRHDRAQPRVHRGCRSLVHGRSSSAGLERREGPFLEQGGHAHHGGRISLAQPGRRCADCNQRARPVWTSCPSPRRSTWCRRCFSFRSCCWPGPPAPAPDASPCPHIPPLMS